MNCCKPAFNRVRGADVDPMFRYLWVFRLVFLVEHRQPFFRLQAALAPLNIVTINLNLSLRDFQHIVQNVGGRMNPITLLAGRRKGFSSAGQKFKAQSPMASRSGSAKLSAFRSIRIPAGSGRFPGSRR
jgi:hypothetical protein